MKRVIPLILFFIFLNVILSNKTVLAADCSIQINGYIQGINRENINPIRFSERPDYQTYTIKITGLGDNQSEIIANNEYLSLIVYDTGIKKEIYMTERGEIVADSSGTAEIKNFKIEKGILNITGPLTFKIVKRKLSYGSKKEKELFEANEANTWCSLEEIKIETSTQEALDSTKSLISSTENPNINFSLPSISFPSSVILKKSCEKEADERNSRPTACYLCTESDLTPSCANSFAVFDKVTYYKTGGAPIEKDWSGDVTVDPSKIKIPFVGLEKNENEINYLADYLEGTNEYYRNYENQVIISNFQGILRKLTPFDYQNKLKKEIVERAKNQEIHDYPVRYVGRLCWDAPVWVGGAKFVIEELLKLNMPDLNHFCIYEDFINNPLEWALIKGWRVFQALTPDELVNWISEQPGVFHVAYNRGVAPKPISSFSPDSGSYLKPPPNPNDFSKEEYQEKFLEWKYDQDGNLTDAAKLWTAIPMLSREDSKGEIDPYLAPENPKDTFEPEEPGIEAVPHLARLYEGSQIIHQTLTPEGKEIEMFNSEEIIKTIPPNTCFIDKYIPTDTGDQLCCDPVKKTLVAWEEFDNPPCIDNLATPFVNECEEEADVSREFGVNLQHPYLDEIWSYTTYADSAGFFNIFRPYEKEPFEDIAAATTVSYGYNPKGIEMSGEISPEEGHFFFPHLGGIQIAKEWVVNQALWPYTE